jgi:hypothetical protein
MAVGVGKQPLGTRHPHAEFEGGSMEVIGGHGRLIIRKVITATCG